MGLQGPQGSQGPQGPQGSQGPRGNANVIYSNWFTPDIYKKDTIYNVWGFSYTLAVPGITQGILDSGAVLVFAKLHGYITPVWPTGQVGQLPITITYQSNGLQIDTWQAYTTPGNLKIRFTNNTNAYTIISNTHQFRYVIIPGGTASGRVRQMSYEEICRMYSIPE